MKDRETDAEEMQNREMQRDAEQREGKGNLPTYKCFKLCSKLETEFDMVTLPSKGKLASCFTHQPLQCFQGFNSFISCLTFLL